MKKKTKRKIIELIVRSGFVITIIMFIIAVICTFRYGEEGFYTKIFISLMLFMAVFSLFLAYKFPYTIERVKVKAHEFPLNISNFDEFIKYLDNNMSKIGYEKFPYLNNYKELACVYFKKTRDTLEYYSIYHFDEIKETRAKTIAYADELMEEFFRIYYEGQDVKDFLKDTFIIWVDKENKTFKEIVNINLDQGNYDGLLIVGISPSNRTIYVADQKEGNNKFMYWELRKKFLKVMNLKMKDKIKK